MKSVAELAQPAPVEKAEEEVLAKKARTEDPQGTVAEPVKEAVKAEEKAFASAIAVTSEEDKQKKAKDKKAYFNQRSV